MPQFAALIVSNGANVIVHDFARGDRLVRGVARHRESDDDIIAHALYLCRRGKKEEAEEYMEEALRRRAS